MAVRIRITWNNYELSYYNRILNLTFFFFFLKSNFGDNPFRENSFFPPSNLFRFELIRGKENSSRSSSHLFDKYR